MKTKNLSVKGIIFLFICSQIIIGQNITWQQTNGPYGGTVQQIAANTNGTDILIATIYSLYKSVDNGEYWSKLNLNWRWSYPPKIIINSKGDYLVGENGSIHKSTDSGNSWFEVIISTNPYLTNLSYDSHNYLYATIGNNIYCSSDDGNTWLLISYDLPVTNIYSLSTTIDSSFFISTDNGLFQSTDIGHTWKNWTQITTNLPTNNIENFVVTKQGTLFTIINGTIYSSKDFGMTWSVSYAPGGIQNNLLVDNTGKIWASFNTILYRSDDNGNNWQLIKDFGAFNYIYSVVVNNDGNVYIGSRDGVFESSDFGNTWSDFKNNGLTATSIHDILVNKSDEIFINTEEDIFISNNNGNSYNSINAKAITNNDFIFVSILDKDNNLYIGTDGLILISNDKWNTWSVRGLPNSKDRPLSAVVQEKNLIVLTQNKIYYSTDSGINWQIIKNFDDNYWNNGKIILCKNGCILAARGTGLYKSNDNGQNWFNISPVENSYYGDFIVNRKGYFIISLNDKVYVSRDEGTTWSSTTLNQVLHFYEIPNGYIYAYSPNQVNYSTNDGDTWSSLKYNQDDEFQITCFSNDREGYLYAGSTGRAVFRSSTPILKILPPEVNANPGDQRAYLTWNKNTSDDFLGYRIYGSYNHYPVTLIDSTTGGADDTTKIIHGLTNDTPYYIVVSAVDNEGNESFSEEIQVNPISVPDIPELYSLANRSNNVSVNQTFKWSNCRNANNYHFQLSNDSLFTNLVINDSTLTDTSKQVTSLNNNTEYFWRVKANGVSGSSEWSEIWSFSTIISAPTAPVVISPNDNAINLSINQEFKWVSSQRAEHYHLQLSKVDDFSNFVINDSTLTDTIFTIELENNTKYYWKVRAKNIGGSSQWTEIQNFTTIIALPDNPVLRIPLNNADNVSPDIVLKWQKNLRAEKYILQVSQDSIFDNLVVNDSLVTDTLYNSGSLICDSRYFWRVKAKNIAGESNWSETWNFKTIIAAPNTPYLIHPNNNSINQPISILFKWQRINDAEKYNIQISLSQDFNGSVENDTAVVDTFKQSDNLVNNTNYFWRIRAKNISGYSPWSEIWNFKTIIAIPNVPNLVSPGNGNKNQPTDIKLTWNSVQDAEAYHLRLSQDSSFINGIVDDSALTTPSKNVNNLYTGMKYYWKVNAKNIAGESPYSSVWNFTTFLPVPDSLKAVSNELRKVKLNWIDKTNNESGFILERKTLEEAGYKFLDTVEVDITSYMDSTVAPATTYKYRIKTYTEYAVSNYSNEAQVTTITKVDEQEKTPTEYKLSQNYPNPFNPITTIKYSIPVSGNVKLKIYDVLGKEIETLVNKEQDKGNYEIKFEGSKLASGIYIYRIESGTFIKSRIMILQK